MPLAISCSYNSRFAVAFQKDSASCSHTKSGSQSDIINKDLKFANFCVNVYECESTGGSEWKLEDCLNLEDVILPDLDSDIDFDYIYGNHEPIRPARSCHSFKNIVFNSNNTTNSAIQVASNNSLSSNNISYSGSNNSINSSSSGNLLNSNGTVIPSTATKISIKRQYSLNNPKNLNVNSLNGTVSKKLIKLDWASTENGSHLLTIGLGNQIFVYSCVTKEIAEQMNKSISETNKLIKSERKNSIMSLLPNTISKIKSNSNSAHSDLGNPILVIIFGVILFFQPRSLQLILNLV
jgi:hypothetical protein